MEQTLDFVFSLLTALVSFLLNIVIFVDRMIRIPMDHYHIDKHAQNVAVVVVSIFLVFSGFRIFGAIIGSLVTVLMLLLLFHIMMSSGYLESSFLHHTQN